ncbi:GTP cyclohydrolase I [uncultured Amnibacterium sp.]|uniref:GTP cyclohydrolase I n=1 Tax=uncultured Amnibacterium sp. TaxID=1631851 RepID=UPI0035CB952B
MDLPRARRAARELLIALGYDPDDAALRATPDRVAAFARDAWPGGRPLPVIDPTALMPAFGPDPVVLDAIPFRSVCEHHLLPFSGTATVVYRPGRWVVGLGRVVAAVDGVARRLQVQERLVEQIADVVEAGLEPAALLVVTRATHACLWARGVGGEDTAFTTTATRGGWAAPIGPGEALELLAAGDRG